MFSLAALIVTAWSQFFFQLLWSQACERGCIHLWLYGLIFENIAVHLHFISEFFWHILHYSIRYCYKDDPQFCWLCGWWHLWNIICIWCFHKGWASSEFSSWLWKRGHCNLGIALILDKHAPHHLHLHIYIQCQQSLPKEGSVPYL